MDHGIYQSRIIQWNTDQLSKIKTEKNSEKDGAATRLKTVKKFYSSQTISQKTLSGQRKTLKVLDDEQTSFHIHCESKAIAYERIWYF